jgi:YebC/PmpR family DNA-binding regulatory protein
MAPPALRLPRRVAVRLPRATIWHPCCRSFVAGQSLLSGHNRWSKIKHEKGAADKKKNAERSLFAKNLTLYSKLHGANPEMNAPLAKVIAEAKKSGMPKANIDLAIARGQGKSSTGDKLETAMLEMMGPGSVAVIIETECDNKQRALKDIKLLARKHGVTVAPTAFLFTRLGRTVLRGTGSSQDDFDAAFMQAVEAGAEDVEQDEDGNVIVWSAPGVTHQVAQSLATTLETDIVTCDIIWAPTADRVRLDDENTAVQLSDFLAAVRDNADVQAVHANPERGEISDEVWRSIEDSLD